MPDEKNESENYNDEGDDDDNKEGEEDEDDVYATPMATPPPEAQDEFLDQSSNNNNSALNFYSNFTLKLNELQVINGNLQTDNLPFYLRKGHSIYHLLEKFDINIQIGLSKFTKVKQVNNNFNEEEAKDSSSLPPPPPPITMKINVNLLKLNVDDIKLINIYRTWANLKHFLDSTSGINNNNNNNSSGKAVQSVERFNPATTAVSSSLSNESESSRKTKNGGQSKNSTYVTVDLNLNEVDITMSLSHSQQMHSNMNEFCLTDSENDEEEQKRLDGEFEVEDRVNSSGTNSR